MAGDNSLQSFELLASAISGKTMHVAQGISGEPAWTDGKTIFIDAALCERDQLAAVFMQASLLSAGSLASDILRKIRRHPKIAMRYLALEGRRALNANGVLLPVWMHSLIDNTGVVRSDSAAESLAIAISGEPLAAPPLIFGVIHANRLLAAVNVEKTSESHAAAQIHAPRQQVKTLEEFDAENIDSDNDRNAAVNKFSVGGAAGIVGRWLQRFLSAARRGDASGAPGTDAATHRSRGAITRAGSLALPAAIAGELENSRKHHGGMTYPEWDMQRRNYRANWCTVREIEPPRKEIAQHQHRLQDTSSLRRVLARIGLGLTHCHRQSQGADIDIDAAIAARIELLAGSVPEENTYIDHLRRRRDLSVLILLDISGSAAESSPQGQTVHEQQMVAAAALASVLYQLGDRVALYAYNSRGRTSVQVVPIKRFDDSFNSLTMQRLYSLEPSAYSRLGAAIRHGAAVLEHDGGTPRKLLLVLSDALAYDHGYEKGYGAADARRALEEARVRGIGGICLTLCGNSESESLQNVFGNVAHATISKPSQMSDVIGALFHSALRHAEVQRRI